MGYPEEKKVEFGAEHQPARRGRTPKRVKYAGQFAEFDDRAADMFSQALDVYKTILDGTFLQPMMNNKTGTVEMVGPTADQAQKAADAIVNRIMGKAASHKEVDVNIERQDTMVILTGDAAAELRSLRRRNKELEERVSQLPAPIEADYALLPAPSAVPAPSPAPASLSDSALSGSAAQLPPTDASSLAFSPVPSSERKVTPSRARAEEGSDVD